MALGEPTNPKLELPNCHIPQLKLFFWWDCSYTYFRRIFFSTYTQNRVWTIPSNAICHGLKNTHWKTSAPHFPSSSLIFDIEDDESRAKHIIIIKKKSKFEHNEFSNILKGLSVRLVQIKLHKFHYEVWWVYIYNMRYIVWSFYDWIIIYFLFIVTTMNAFVQHSANFKSVQQLTLFITNLWWFCFFDYLEYSKRKYSFIFFFQLFTYELYNTHI